MGKGFHRRLAVVAVLVGLGFAALAARLFTVQIRDRARLVAYADRQLRRTLTVRGRRGDILDARGRPLAVSVDSPSLFANARQIARPAAAARALAPILGVPERGLRKKLAGGKSYVWLGRQITPAQRRRVEALRIAGLGFVTESRRFYPKRELAASLVGFVGVDEAGLTGVELAFDGRMRGRAGRVRIERDARGRSVHPEARVLVPPRTGEDVRLTVDGVLQYIVEKELLAQVRRVGARRAIGVMVEPATGRVLAMASVPAFNPNAYRKAPPARWREPAVQEVYEPGSTFKLVTAAAFLESGGRLDQRFYAERGTYRIGRGRFTLRDHKKFGWLTAREVIVNSSNIGAYKMGVRAGPEALYRTARRLGFGAPTGVGLPGEARGILRPPKRWSGTSLAAVSIGQEVGVTPLQMVMAVAAIANGGVLVPPRILARVERDGKVLRGAPPARGRRALSPRTARLLARTMRRVVTAGTGVRAEVPGYGAAGKTGTAQKAEPGERGYSRSKFIMSFVGFVPYKKPRFALLVVVDEGKGPGGAWGGTVAAPVWRRIAWQALRYLRVPPEGARILTVARAEGGAASRAGEKETSFSGRVLEVVKGVRRMLHGPVEGAGAR